MSSEFSTENGMIDTDPVGQGDDDGRAFRRHFRRSQVDARRLYRLVLNRDPEAGGSLESFGDFTFEDQLRAFFNAQEFIDRTVTPLLTVGRVGFQGRPEPRLLTWVSRRLPLSQVGRSRIGSIRDWPSLYLTLLSDEIFKGLFSPDYAVVEPAFLGALRRMALFRGSLEEAQPDLVKGWVAQLGPGEAPLRVEIWIDGAFAAAGSPSLFRRDVQDQIGGDGIAGFEIALPVARDGRETPLRIEVREASCGFIIGSATVGRTPPSIGVLSTISQQLSEVRAQLDRLERQLPVAQHQLSSSVEDYEGHYDRWLRQDRATSAGGAVTVILDTLGQPIRAIGDAVARILDQADEGVALLVLIDPVMQAALEDMINRANWRGIHGVQVVVSSKDDRAAAILAAIGSLAATAPVLLTQARHVLEKDAVAQIVAALSEAPDCDALYGDHDVFHVEDLARDIDFRRHSGPTFKPAFDRDLFYQRDYVGSCIAVRAHALRSASLRTEAGDHYGGDVLLRLADTNIRHLDRILSTSWPSGPCRSSEWASCVRHHLAGGASSALIEPHSDILGAQVEGAIRVRYPVPAGTRVAVIIPTRDRLDLIKPCIDSLLNHATASQCVPEIIVVDHENSDAEVIDYLEERRQAGLIRVLAFEGAFNWALMNNLAAAQTDAEVLVFLNDDTIVITPDWIDELASQALRPDVGVVGCRLVYADGTIQHAGFVMREVAATFLIHDGVGVPGADGGYLARHALMHQVVAVTGACMALSRDVFRRLGGFDAANFPVEGNDVDLCFRAAASGLSVLYDPYATFYHLESKTRGFSADGERRRVSETALALLWDRWGKAMGADPGFNMNFDRWGRPFARLRPPVPSTVQVYTRGPIRPTRLAC